MSAAYTPLPTQADPNGYPPPRSKALLSRLTPTAPPTRIRRLLLFLAVLALSSTLLVYLVFLPSSNGWIIPQNLLNGQGYGYTEPGDTSSPFFRDPHPALHTRLFLARAQAEIRSRRLDTCNGKLSTPMVDGYMNAAVEYCTPHDTSPAAASITCFPARGSSSPNSWWPYPQAFCASRNLAHTHGWGGDLKQRGRFTAACAVTSAGAKLNDDMGREMFLGKEFDAADAAPDRACGETIAHPVLFVPRQDRWNPFHVGEDLVTTFLALMLFSRHSASSSSLFSGASKLWTSLPDAYAKYASSSSSNGDAAAAAESDFAALRGQLAHELQGTEGLQLIFQDDYRPTESLFAPLYDRMGAFSPRRTGAEALGEGGPTCFSTAFHSVGAGASLLSGTGVGKEFTCASELVWGASLWLRWIWGLEELPGGYGGEEDEGGLFRRAGRFSRRAGEDEALARRAPVAAQSGHRDPLQVLFLSREKFDSYTRHQHNGGLTPWQEARHIVNEHELVAGLRAGLASLCRTVTHVGVAREGTTAHTPGSYDCTYTDADALPGSWGLRMHPREARALGLKTAQTPKTVQSDSSTAQGEQGHAHSQPRRHDPWIWTNATDGFESEYSDAGGAHTRRAAAGTARALRFATLDPTTTALAAQIGAVGRTDVVVSVHAGALGLTLFMPTGRASVVELTPPAAMGNNHFHNIAHMLGMEYLRIHIAKSVDVSAVVGDVRRIIERRLLA